MLVYLMQGMLEEEQTQENFIRHHTLKKAFEYSVGVAVALKDLLDCA
jgi:hypothetical protein